MTQEAQNYAILVRFLFSILVVDAARLQGAMMEIVGLNYDTRLDVLNIAVTYNFPVHTIAEGSFSAKAGTVSRFVQVYSFVKQCVCIWVE